MAVLVTDSEVIIPASVRRRAGIKAGDRVEFEASSGVITVRKTADQDEYTPAQRRIIEPRLAKSHEDVRQGRVYGPFAASAELERSLREVGKASAAKRNTSKRK
jgi:AbrB family looped-hinge helix DNA binding protein